MAEPPFTMSKYANETDLLRDKCAWLEGLNAKLREALAMQASHCSNGSIHATAVPFLRCRDPERMGEHACINRHKCWEPCGDLGKSEEHARAAPEAEADALRTAIGQKS